jgi:hypothetical protein
MQLEGRKQMRISNFDVETAWRAAILNTEQEMEG